MMNNIPRRSRIDQSVSAENAIRNAAAEIEKIGADVRLTKALNLLWEAKDLVSDYIDEKLTRKDNPQ